MKKLISIVMPSYNQGQFIKESIDSVLNQDYPNKELIVVDAASTDGTIDILKSYNDRIKWISEPDQGQSDALNKGFAMAQGDILGWLNSDDLYESNIFHEVIQLFETFTEKQIVFGDYYTIDAFGTNKVLNPAFDFNLKHFVYEGFHCNAQAMFWRKELMNLFGEFDVTLHRTMDYDMILRFGMIVGNQGFYRTQRPLASFRRHDQQKTMNRGYKKTKRLEEPVYKEHYHIAEKNGFIKKFTFIGEVYRFFYRLRRVYWYSKRGVLLSNLKKKFFNV